MVTNKTYPLIVGIGGCSRVGKDTWATLLSEYLLENSHLPIDVKCFSLASKVKEECKQIVWDKYKLDVFSDNSEQKSTFRHLLVEYCDRKRYETNGQYFINDLKLRVYNWWERKNFSPRSIVIIPDVRQKQYFYDEPDFALRHGVFLTLDLIKGSELVQPANDQEKINYPILKSLTSRNYSWRSIDFSKLHPNERRSVRNNSVGELGSEILAKLD
jgi:hypothetical protein